MVSRWVIFVCWDSRAVVKLALSILRFSISSSCFVLVSNSMVRDLVWSWRTLAWLSTAILWFWSSRLILASAPIMVFWFASILSACWGWVGDCGGVVGGWNCVLVLSALKRSMWMATEGEAMVSWFVLLGVVCG